jgi:hypothetical protein
MILGLSSGMEIKNPVEVSPGAQKEERARNGSPGTRSVDRESFAVGRSAERG